MNYLKSFKIFESNDDFNDLKSDIDEILADLKDDYGQITTHIKRRSN